MLDLGISVVQIDQGIVVQRSISFDPGPWIIQEGQELGIGHFMAGHLKIVPEGKIAVVLGRSP